ncbi:non-homologous end joining protein Ku [Amycolatopsis sp. H20-H5]|uniref:non-homologous end joining protein Ku n=1 Tax=Amycolatopsis sp. H20-H5 TaxID=3046309 RepID=UPI002DB7911A|nr:Ku protein [Amycolatopsis sp. H20-H5]MEC3976703.1 Ku protein [Amycolatopsis sp. H20-H5]
MARPIWSGVLTLGLVTVPVELYSATGDHSVHFRQFERGTADRVRNRRVNERTGDEVGFSDVVKGYELDDGEYVLVEPDELDEVAPGRSRALEIDAFVDLGEIDPVYYQRSYWLAPAKAEFGHAYGLLVAALARAEKAGIAKFVMRGKEYLAAVRAGDGVLALQTLHFAADLRDPAKELDKLPGPVRPKAKELDMAVNLIESMSEPWRPEDYTDTYTERVEKLVKAKKKGRKVTPDPEPDESGEVVDLFDALSRSVRRGRAKPKKAKGGKAKQPALAGLSKAELDKLARQRDIKGRSKMTRADLEQALHAS